MRRFFQTLRPRAKGGESIIIPPDSPSKKSKTTDDLEKNEKKIETPVKQLHSKSDLEDIIVRKWCNTMHSAPGFVPEFNFSICTQNILADRYVNFNSYAYCPKKYMYQRYRHRKLLQSIEHYRFDIMCFQELQGNMAEYILKRIGEEYDYRYKRITPYDAWRKKKEEDPKLLKKHEGVGIFWKKSEFEFVDKLELELNKIAHEDVATNLRSNTKRKKVLASVCQHSHNVSLTCLLKHKKSSKTICVSTIHGYYRKDHFIGQTYQNCNFFRKVHEYIQGKDVDGVLVCGDFNIYHTSKALKFIENGKLKIKEKDDQLNETNVFRILKRKPTHELRLKRSYPSKFKPFSHFSARKKQLDTLDYIFHQPAKMQPVQVLRISKKEIKGKFPSKHQNSDHLMLGARIKIFSDEEIKKREEKIKRREEKKAKLSSSIDIEEVEGEEEKFNF